MNLGHLPWGSSQFPSGQNYTSRSIRLCKRLISNMPIICLVHHFKSYIIIPPSPFSILLHSDFRGFILGGAPSRLFVALGPIFLNITQSSLDLMDDLCIAGVFPNVIADLDSGCTVRRGELDDDVQWGGFGAGGKACEVICNVRHTSALDI